MVKKYYRDSKGRFISKTKPKIVKAKVVKPKVVKKPIKKVQYRDSKGRFTTKEKAVKIIVIEPSKIPRKMKTGTYKITKIIDDLGSARYLVWSNKLEWNKRLAKLKRDYGITEILGTKTHTYEPFLTKKAIKEFYKLGIIVNS